jgi:hypothetical protein
VPIALFMAAAGVIGLVASLFLRERPVGAPTHPTTAGSAVAPTSEVAPARS